MNWLKTSLFLGLALPSMSFADDLSVIDAWIPVAPPGVMSHAAYLTLENTDDAPKSVVSIKAEGYGMAHLHKTEETDGIATMSMIHQLEIPVGKSLAMAPGGLHIMLMRPQNPLKAGDTVTLTLGFADGSDMELIAEVRARNGSS